MAKQKHDFQYFVHEGVSNMFSHGFMSFAAIGITVACLLIMGTFTLVAVNANGSKGHKSMAKHIADALMGKIFKIMLCHECVLPHSRLHCH